MAILHPLAGKTAIDFDTNKIRSTDIKVETVRIFYIQKHNGKPIECYDDYPVKPEVEVKVMPLMVKILSDLGVVVLVLSDFESLDMQGFITTEDKIVLHLDRITWSM